MKKIFFFISLISIITSLLFLGKITPASAIDNNNYSAYLITAKVPEYNFWEEATCPNFTQKIDLNNANIIAFKDCQGFYPQLASLIIRNSPYQKVEDILEIPELSNYQKKLLKSQLKNFIVTEAQVPLESRMPPRPSMR